MTPHQHCVVHIIIMMVGVIGVNNVDSYSMELTGQNAITTLNITCFLLQDYSLDENILLVWT